MECAVSLLLILSAMATVWYSLLASHDNLYMPHVRQEDHGIAHVRLNLLNICNIVYLPDHYYLLLHYASINEYISIQTF